MISKCHSSTGICLHRFKDLYKNNERSKTTISSTFWSIKQISNEISDRNMSQYHRNLKWLKMCFLRFLKMISMQYIRISVWKKTNTKWNALLFSLSFSINSDSWKQGHNQTLPLKHMFLKHSILSSFSYLRQKPPLKPVVNMCSLISPLLIHTHIKFKLKLCVCVFVCVLVTLFSLSHSSKTYTQK